MNWDQIIADNMEAARNSMNSSDQSVKQDTSTNLQKNIIFDKEPQADPKNRSSVKSYEDLNNFFQKGGRFERGSKLASPLAQRLYQPKADAYYKAYKALEQEYNDNNTPETPNEDVLDWQEDLTFYTDKIKELDKEIQIAKQNGDKENYSALNAKKREYEELLDSYNYLLSGAKKDKENRENKNKSLVKKLKDLYQNFKNLQNEKENWEGWVDARRAYEKDLKSTLDEINEKLNKYKNNPDFNPNDEEYKNLKIEHMKLINQIEELEDNREKAKLSLNKHGLKPANYSFNDYDFENLDLFKQFKK